MCGITGWVDFRGLEPGASEVVEAMNETLGLRGPDGTGLWQSAEACFGHKRLAVIDLEGGAQPISLEGTPRLLTISYNGEIYNFRELREELVSRGHRFRTASDTEVILVAWAEWGPYAVDRLNGIFAFAIWDGDAQELWLVRDRLGVKPLYYHDQGPGVLFGSEIKAILAHPDVRAVVGQEGAAQLLLPLVKTPGRTPFDGIEEVLPGEALVFRRTGRRSVRYWRVESLLEERPSTLSLADAAADLRFLLDDTIARQTVADVPLCTLLSGGLDSSAITAIAQGLPGLGGVNSFSVDFEDQAGTAAARSVLDRQFAREAADFIGTRHRNIVLDSKLLADPVTRDACVRARDLPIGIGDLDLSLYLLCREVRGHATVALSGEAADEILAGYRWFREPSAVWSATFPWMADSPAHGRLHQRIIGAFDSELTRELRLEEYVADLYATALGRLELGADLSDEERRQRQVAYLAVSYFLPTLLDRNDRLSMASGLEVRVPFCDHRIVEHLLRLSLAVHSADGREKSVLRGAVQDILPPGVLQRDKSPYPSVPDPAYSRQVVQQVEAVPSAQRADVARFFTPAIFEPEHLASRAQATALISNVEAELALNFASWLRQYSPELAF